MKRRSGEETRTDEALWALASYLDELDGPGRPILGQRLDAS